MATAVALDEWFWWSVRVYYEDTDAGGIVYNANYLRYFERARTEWRRTLGVEHGTLGAKHGLQLILSRAHLNFVAPARLDDVLQVGGSVARVGRVAIDLKQIIRSSEKPSAFGRVLCKADVRATCVDVTHLRPRPPPAALLGALS